MGSNVHCRMHTCNCPMARFFPWIPNIIPTTTCCRHAPNKILINTMNVQMQVGGSDCGLFALAFITAVLNGQDPTFLYFDQEKMRQHLCECLEKCTPLPFPTIKLQKRRRHVLHTNVVPVFCDCRLPDNGSRMVQCAGCLKWYHVKCAVENENELKKKDWFCTHC